MTTPQADALPDPLDSKELRDLIHELCVAYKRDDEWSVIDHSNALKALYEHLAGLALGRLPATQPVQGMQALAAIKLYLLTAKDVTAMQMLHHVLRMCIDAGVTQHLGQGLEELAAAPTPPAPSAQQTPAASDVEAFERWEDRECAWRAADGNDQSPGEDAAFYAGCAYVRAQQTTQAVATDDLKLLVDRFLAWKLPADFRPDAGISFKATYNERSPFGPSKHEPTGTNLFTADQARAMLAHVLGVIEPQAAQAVPDDMPYHSGPVTTGNFAAPQAAAPLVAAQPVAEMMSTGFAGSPRLEWTGDQVPVGVKLYTAPPPSDAATVRDELLGEAVNVLADISRDDESEESYVRGLERRIRAAMTPKAGS